MSLAPTGKTLGQGSYATVKEAVKTGERFAVKMISKKLMQGKEHMILNEIEVLQEDFETPNNHPAALLSIVPTLLVMDLCTGGELFDRICDRGNFYEDDAADIIRTVVDAVQYLHDQNIVHRDIKPENLLFKTKDDTSELMIADFGLSKVVDSDRIDALRTTCGTPGYMAPEVLRKSGHGKPVDMWCIGVMTYFLLCGYMPFDFNTKSSQEEMENILSAKYTFEDEYWLDVSETARDFIRKLLIVDPAARMTAKQALAHPWLSKSGVVPEVQSAANKNLLPKVIKGFDARRVFRKAIDVVKAVNKLSHSPSASRSQLNVPGHSPGSPQSLSVSSFSLVGQTPDGHLGVPPSSTGLSVDLSQWSLNDIRPKEDPLVDGKLMVIVSDAKPAA
ncbi:Calcium/calmodulin-dependent protein kinase type I [Polyrhizophydium stewartii]|uniref:Calcium/calmodulin-dependent protein kinase type I n=1 Tax=Polyrhizophydium stewartii TaxID=2732419 RepID=A0ABR4NDQ6_9FUNG